MFRSKNIARPRPRSFARYIAVSALRISSSIVVPVIREQRDADARRDVVILAADIHRQLQGLDDAFGDGARGIRIRDVAQDHRELIAAETRDGVAILHARAQALRDDGEQLIARRVIRRCRSRA